ncbi:MAG: hypothetical protein AAFX08_06795 [Pseudomonadota bacterium]
MNEAIKIRRASPVRELFETLGATPSTRSMRAGLFFRHLRDGPEGAAAAREMMRRIRNEKPDAGK